MPEHGELGLPHLVIEGECMEQDEWRPFAVFVGNNWVHNEYSLSIKILSLLYHAIHRFPILIRYTEHIRYIGGIAA